MAEPAVVGKDVTAGVPQHVWVGLVGAGDTDGALDRSSEAGRGERRAALATKAKGDLGHATVVSLNPHCLSSGWNPADSKSFMVCQTASCPRCSGLESRDALGSKLTRRGRCPNFIRC
jgi:hypothetical protein